jgi:acetyltransferase-like isoleucine patch superfamily enzyme
LKSAAIGLSLLLVTPGAIAELALRMIFRRDVWFSAQTQLLSLLPGNAGSYLRNAYYFLVLRRCHLSCRFSFGMLFTHSDAIVGRRVYIGAYSTIGKATIGDDTMIADRVGLLSGSHQHTVGDPTAAFQQQPQVLQPIMIGRNVWIGSNSVVMADVEDNSIVGAGSVVSRPIPANSVAVGNPARVIRTLIEDPGTKPAQSAAQASNR